jgi:hypothetical protein
MEKREQFFLGRRKCEAGQPLLHLGHSNLVAFLLLWSKSTRFHWANENHQYSKAHRLGKIFIDLYGEPFFSELQINILLSICKSVKNGHIPLHFSSFSGSAIHELIK